MGVIEFEELDSWDENNYRIIDFNMYPELIDTNQPTPLATDGYQIQCWIYNAKNCYTCQDKKYPNKKWVLPTISHYISSPYGERFHPIAGYWKKHNGVDIADNAYSPILAATDGKVTTADYQWGGAGHYVKITHSDGLVTIYMHMGPADGTGTYSHIVKVGQKVTAGQIIGAIGTSGGSTGNHLHFGMMEGGNFIDPASRINFASQTREDMSAISLRVQKELPSYDDFSPLFGTNTTGNFGGGTPYQQHVRRGYLIDSCSLYLFDQGKIDRRFGTGSSCIGPMKYLGDSYDTEVDIKVDDNYFSPDTNPYINQSQSCNNNAYAWAKAMKLLDITRNSNKENLLCTHHNEDWYKHNIEEKLFAYGLIPRKSAIACWKYMGKNNNCETTRVAIVEEVLGTDIITVSEYPHGESAKYIHWKDVKDKDIEKKTITNPDYNWSQDKENYKFLGFIYLLDNSETNPSTVSVHQDGSIMVVADAINKYSTIVFGISDIKHYNKIKIVCDVNAYTENENLPFDANISCGLNISASHQLVNCEKPDEAWRTTRFNKTPGYDITNNPFTCHYPFPMGAMAIHDEQFSNINNGVVEKSITYKLNECVLNNKKANPFAIDGYTALNRELPFYISITPISFVDDEKDTPVTVEVTLKKIILYR